MFGKANCLVLKLKNPMTHHALVFSRKHRACLRLATLFCFAGLSLGMANAQTAGASSAANAYPAGPVTLLVPFTTGTGADLMARLLGPKLADKWKVSVVTDNKAGASGSIGTGMAAKAAPNGLTVLVTATAHGTFPALMPKLAFNLDALTHHLHQALADSQPKSGTAIFATDGAVGLREGLEELRDLFFRQANTGIVHRKFEHHSLGSLLAKLCIDEHFSGWSKFDGVAHQIDQHLSQAGWIAHQQIGNIGRSGEDQFQAFFICAVCQQA